MARKKFKCRRWPNTLKKCRRKKGEAKQACMRKQARFMAQKIVDELMLQARRDAEKEE